MFTQQIRHALPSEIMGVYKQQARSFTIERCQFSRPVLHEMSPQDLWYVMSAAAATWQVNRTKSVKVYPPQWAITFVLLQLLAWT
jgi:hypothetical protein